MTKPWERYQSVESAGPWVKYQNQSDKQSQDDDLARLQDSGWAQRFHDTNQQFEDAFVDMGKGIAHGAASSWGPVMDVVMNNLGGGVFKPSSVKSIEEGVIGKPGTMAGEMAEHVPDLVLSQAGWSAGVSLLPKIAAAGRVANAGKIALEGAAGGIGSQVATGEVPTAKTTAIDSGINLLTHGAINSTAKFMNIVRGLIGRPQQEVLDAAKVIGVKPTVAVATGTRPAKEFEDFLAGMPFSAAPIATAREMEIGSIDSFLSGMQKGRETDSGKLGDNIKQAVKDYVETFQKESAELYDAAYSKIKPSARIKTPSFGEALRDIDERFRFDPDFSDELSNGFISRIAKKFRSAEEKQSSEETQDALYALTGQLQTGEMSFGTARHLRQKVWDEIGNPKATFKGVSDADLKHLWGELTQDMDNFVGGFGGDALKSWKEASAHYAEGRGVADNLLKRYGEGKSGDEIYLNMFGSPDGRMKAKQAQELKDIFSVLPDETVAQVRGEFINRMGLEGPGSAGADGRGFSPLTFMTNWNRLTPEAKRALFDADHMDNLNAVATYTAAMKQVEGFKNHSGTAAHSAMASLVNGVKDVANLVRLPAYYATARLLANPDFTEWLAKTSISETPEEVKNNVAKLVAVYFANPLLQPDVEKYVDSYPRDDEEEKNK
ncbi:Uncharacterised protein [Serratia quinivorans]|uniref:hypothetical protein n=1 Tax=Serratia quinivorans TaxID=137545 RepID=UPI002179280A|nr:hypothetical protein [Serratia quinivorans]CAI1769248.1 Uncharacterised protein [Serratia quinivorans]